MSGDTRLRELERDAKANPGDGEAATRLAGERARRRNRHQEIEAEVEGLKREAFAVLIAAARSGAFGPVNHGAPPEDSLGVDIAREVVNIRNEFSRVSKLYLKHDLGEGGDL